MTAPSRHAPRVIELFERGFDQAWVAAVTGVSPSWVRVLHLRWEATRAEERREAIRAATDPRAVALERGRALVAAKVAAGEWVLPKGAGE